MDDADRGIVVVGADGRIQHLNPAAARLLGVRPGRVVRRPACEVLRTVVDGEDPVGDALRAARTEREAMLLAPGGVELPVLLRTARVGVPARVLLSIQDLTQTRRMREELRRHERLATLGQLSAGVAHEIRNPLAGIGTSAQVLLRRFEPRDDRSRFVRVILDEVSRLDRIVNGLLQYARPQPPQLRPAPLEPCVRRVLETQRQAFADARIEVEVSVAPRMPKVWIDPDLVQQVLLNVTVNAVQAMPDGGRVRVELRIARRRRPPRGPGRRASDAARGAAAGASGWIRYAQIRVGDTGSGIARGALAKLFDPFFSTKPQGTGLGLAICQTIMQEHGGSIEVESREGQGTTVLLNFPVEKRHGERRQRHARAGRPHAAHRG
jgi:signal transduction histidine kinase